ncbi:phosphoadenylyl-sulfate reductase [Curvibacter sp. APW13]|uniref:phosphoadenylyl-sulfate reductase n=1 Tax=Curvibacter sp. APW13 TaxID=3077236 RepID=UPI0028DE5F72|nr:phosphoadenylyl-sulfate reductase [Curvibacter sp. APW13]MDT8991658.1 phosphoadenylyl-sulfate reductase [Curvibacter sp. APW13]
MSAEVSALPQRFAPQAQPAGSAIARNAAPSQDYIIKLAETQNVLQQAAATYRRTDTITGASVATVTQASSLGAEDVVISHLINSLKLDIPVFVLETGALHTETLALLERFQSSSRAPVTVYKPVNESVVQFVAREGADAMYKSITLRKACCGIRKMEPLARALAGKGAWITGLRREQSGARADVPLVDTSEQRTKLNPLANWTWGDVWHYIRENAVDYNPLHDQFFPSIGCEPCTRAIALGEDFRAGRWWWEDESAKECGLHVKQDKTAA